MNNSLLIPLIILNNNNKLNNNIIQLSNNENYIPSSINQTQLNTLTDKNKETQAQINNAMNILSKPLFTKKTLKNTLSNNNKSKLLQLLRQRKLYEKNLKQLEKQLKVSKIFKFNKVKDNKNNYESKIQNIKAKLNELNSKLLRERMRIKHKYNL